MSAGETAQAVRTGVGLFALDARGLVSVSGGDRVTWLQGQTTNDVARLDPDGPESGCYALVLTVQGRIVADVHVLARPDRFWLETARDAVAPLLERLRKTLVADDVELEDASDAFARLSLEGPRAGELLARLAGDLPVAAPECVFELELAGAPVVAAAYGLTGLPAFQLFVAPHRADAVRQALVEAGGDFGLVVADEGALEILRVECGTPAWGRELDTDVLPGEAPLERAISITKGCYTGQEVVERMRSRGRAAHRLVGLRFPGGEIPVPGAELRAEGKKIGGVTSVAQSPAAGAIGLGYVRDAHAEPGAELDCQGRSAVVSPLPFVPDPAA